MRSKIAIAVGIFSSFLNSTALNNTNATVTPIEINSVHIPYGFDSNDQQVEFVVAGDLPNTCYQRPTAQIKFDGKDITVKMTASKISGEGVFCIQALVPYMVSVKLGQLAEGSYQVMVNPQQPSEIKAELDVATPNSQSIDNFTYANVTNVHKGKNKKILVLEGEHPSSCMDIASVNILINKTGDTIAVLPIVEQIKPICDQMVKPFKLEIPLPAGDPKPTVYHVRKIDGTAINYLSK